MIDYQPRWLVLRRRARTPWHYIVTTPRVLAPLLRAAVDRILRASWCLFRVALILSAAGWLAFSIIFTLAALSMWASGHTLTVFVK